LIASGLNVAFGAPRLFKPAGDGDSGAFVGEFPGTAFGGGVIPGAVDVDGVSLGAGVGAGDGFFFRRGEALGDAVGEAFSRARGATDGVGNAFAGSSAWFFFGKGLGEGDAFFGVRFFFRGVGVGVGVEKIFLIVSVNDGSAADTGAMGEAARAMTRSNRMSITNLRRTEVAIS
jgi:hypothetical protein